MKMRINWFDREPEIRDVDGSERTRHHVFKIAREGKDLKFNIEFLYGDEWVNGYEHNNRIEKQ